MLDSLGDRMKKYESAFQYQLPARSNLLIRVDGRTFSSFTKSFEKPFDQKIIDVMVDAAVAVAQDLQGFKLAYTQSDEASFLITDYDTLNQQSYFGNNLNKIVSMTASIMTAHFNKLIQASKLAYFDSRAFIISDVNDVPNYFLWRTRDLRRNSIFLLGRKYFSDQQLHGKNSQEIKQMLLNRGIPWEDIPNQIKNGTFILKDFSIKTDFESSWESIKSLIDKK